LNFIIYKIIYCKEKKRFPRKSIEILKNWYDLHAENTFAKKETKIELAKQTNLSVVQVSKWLNDQRARRKKVLLKPIKNSISSKKILRDYFENVTRTPTNLEIKNLKKLTGLSEKKINYWFYLKNRF
jgi:hypothetical protein